MRAKKKRAGLFQVPSGFLNQPTILSNPALPLSRRLVSAVGVESGVGAGCCDAPGGGGVGPGALGAGAGGLATPPSNWVMTSDQLPFTLLFPRPPPPLSMYFPLLPAPLPKGLIIVPAPRFA